MIDLIINPVILDLDKPIPSKLYYDRLNKKPVILELDRPIPSKLYYDRFNNKPGNFRFR